MKKSKDYSTVQLTIDAESGRVLDHTVRLKKTGYKSYFNAQHIYFQLNNLERSFFEYLIEKADENALVYVIKPLKLEYIDFIGKVIGTSKQIKLASLDQITPKLKKLGLLIPLQETHGMYFINPKYVYKGSEKGRVTAFNNILDHCLLNKLPISMLVDTPDHLMDAK
jgi:hypothetical protein